MQKDIKTSQVIIKKVLDANELKLVKEYSISASDRSEDERNNDSITTDYSEQLALFDKNIDKTTEEYQQLGDLNNELSD